jgi:hypothetical protein
VGTYAHRSQLGDLDALREAVHLKDFIPPLLALQPGAGWVVLMGERRWEAMRLERLPGSCYVARTFSHVLSWMLLDIARPGGSPMSMVEAVYLIQKIQQCVPTTKRDELDRTICEYLSLDVDQVRETRYMLRWIDKQYPEAIQEMARRELDGVHKGTAGRPSSADARITREFKRLTQPQVSPAQQRKILNNSAAVAAGLIDGIQALGTLADTLDPGECAQWATQFGAARRELERLTRQLKERGNTQ